MPYSSVALLVDGDNVSAKFAEQIISRTQAFGHITVQNVYGRANSLTNWSAEKNFKPIEVQPLKKAADFQLSFDAVEMAAKNTVEAFVIVSSDRDLAHVASRLKEKDFPVLGIGEPKAPSEFKSACDDFHRLHCEVATQKLEKLLEAVFNAKGNSRKGILMNRIDGLVRKVDRDFNIKDTLYGKWARYIEDEHSPYCVTGANKNRRVKRLLPG